MYFILLAHMDTVTNLYAKLWDCWWALIRWYRSIILMSYLFWNSVSLSTNFLLFLSFSVFDFLTDVTLIFPLSWVLMDALTYCTQHQALVATGAKLAMILSGKYLLHSYCSYYSNSLMLIKMSSSLGSVFQRAKENLMTVFLCQV